MKKPIIRILIILVLFICLFFYSFNTTKDVTICTWNLEHFGQTKSAQEINFIAKTVSHCDVLAIQEVVGVKGGMHAVIHLKRSLDSQCTSCDWDYMFSPITSGHTHQRERYAYLWQRSKVTKKGNGWLDKRYSEVIEREPFLAKFASNGKDFTLVSFHAIPKNRQPESEIKYLKYFPQEYPDLNLIFMGDFNTPQSNNVFNPLKKMGYKPALTNQKTSLRQKCINGDCLASRYDNIFYSDKYIQTKYAGIIPFYRKFPDMKAARHISDHVPVVFRFVFK